MRARVCIFKELDKIETPEDGQKSSGSIWNHVEWKCRMSNTEVRCTVESTTDMRKVYISVYGPQAQDFILITINR